MNPNLEKISQKMSNVLKKERKTYTIKCEKCENDFKLKLTENQYKKGNYKRYCSQNCSNSVNGKKRSFDNSSNTKSQGGMGIGKCISYFLSKGYGVFVPVCDNQRYDLIIDINGSLKKVEVKTTTQKDKRGNFTVTLKTCGGNQSFHIIKVFDKTSLDYLFILDSDGNEYLIPSDNVQSTTSLNLKVYEKYKI